VLITTVINYILQREEEGVNAQFRKLSNLGNIW